MGTRRGWLLAATGAAAVALAAVAGFLTRDDQAGLDLLFVSSEVLRAGNGEALLTPASNERIGAFVPLRDGYAVHIQRGEQGGTLLIRRGTSRATRTTLRGTAFRAGSDTEVWTASGESLQRYDANGAKIGSPVRLTGALRPIAGLAGDRLLLLDADGHVVVWDPAAGPPGRPRDLGLPIGIAARHVAYGAGGCEEPPGCPLWIDDVTVEGEPVTHWTRPSGAAVSGGALDPEGRWLAVAWSTEDDSNDVYVGIQGTPGLRRVMTGLSERVWLAPAGPHLLAVVEERDGELVAHAVDVRSGDVRDAGTYPLVPDLRSVHAVPAT